MDDSLDDFCLHTEDHLEKLRMNDLHLHMDDNTGELHLFSDEHLDTLHMDDHLDNL